MRWPTRLLVGYFLFDMVVRSFISLTPYDTDWYAELAMDLRPLALPPTGNREQIAQRDETLTLQPFPARLESCAVSLGRFFIPWPGEKTRQRIGGPADCGKFALTWLGSRLRFVGSLVGVDQDFPMFSPNVGASDTVGRLRLYYADGAETVLHTLADPQDITCFFHGIEEKKLQAAIKIEHDGESRLGYCNWIAHRFATNGRGAALVRIDVFRVRYDYPSPGDDARAWYERQLGPPPAQIEPPFWTYDVATRRGRYL
jgi:hypothetical protein